jgi:hypothetical protein
MEGTGRMLSSYGQVSDAWNHAKLLVISEEYWRVWSAFRSVNWSEQSSTNKYAKYALKCFVLLKKMLIRVAQYISCAEHNVWLFQKVNC